MVDEKDGPSVTSFQIRLCFHDVSSFAFKQKKTACQQSNSAIKLVGWNKEAQDKY